MAGEGEGVLIPVEAKDQLSGALQHMAAAAAQLNSSLSSVNKMLHDTGDHASNVEKKGSGFLGFLNAAKNGMERLTSFKVKDLMSDIENMSVAGIAIGGSMIEGTRHAMEMETSMARLSLSSRVTKKDLADLQSETFKLANESKISANAFADSGARLLKEGKSAAEAAPILSAVGKASERFGTDYTTTFRQIQDATKAFNMDLSTIPTSLDMVAKIGDETNTSMEEMLAPMQRLAPTAKAIGLNFNDVTGLIGAFGKSGMGSSMAMRVLQVSMQRAAAHGLDYKTVLKEIGGAYQHASSQQERNLLLTQTFGPRALALGTVFEKTGGDIKKMTAEFTNAAGTLDKDMGTVDATTEERFAQIKNRVDTAFTQVSQKYLPVINAFAATVQKLPPEIIVGAVGGAQAMGVMAKGIEVASQAAIAFKLLNLGAYFQGISYFARLSGLAMAGVWTAGILGAAALGVSLGMIINKFAETHRWARILQSVLTLGIFDLGGAVASHGGNVASRGAASFAGSTEVETLRKSGLGGGNTKEAAREFAPVFAIEARKGTTTVQREHIKELIKEIGGKGIHIDNAHFHVTKDMKAKDVESLLTDLLQRGQSNTPAAGGRVTR